VTSFPFFEFHLLSFILNFLYGRHSKPYQPWTSALRCIQHSNPHYFMWFPHQVTKFSSRTAQN